MYRLSPNLPCNPSCCGHETKWWCIHARIPGWLHGWSQVAPEFFPVGAMTIGINPHPLGLEGSQAYASGSTGGAWSIGMMNGVDVYQKIPWRREGLGSFRLVGNLMSLSLNFVHECRNRWKGWGPSFLFARRLELV